MGRCSGDGAAGWLFYPHSCLGHEMEICTYPFIDLLIVFGSSAEKGREREKDRHIE